MRMWQQKKVRQGKKEKRLDDETDGKDYLAKKTVNLCLL